MASAANNVSSTVRRRKGADQVSPNGHGERDEQSSGREQGLTGDRLERGPRDEHDEQWRDRVGGERRSDREPRRQSDGVQLTAVRSASDQLERPTDWVEPVLAAWRQVFTSMFDLAGTMARLQQQTFASMIGSADTNAVRMANGEQHGGVHDAVSGSRTSSVVPDRIEHARR
jgi:hypothetical protein